MTEYQIEANTRRCAASGRQLQPGEKYFSVLLDEGGKFLRRDYSAEAWQGPPEGAFSFWAGRIPAAGDSGRPKIDDEMLLDCFQRLEADDEPGRVNFRYIVALLLMRRKRFRFEEARMDGDQEILVLRCVRTGQQVRVINPLLSEEQMAAVQEEVFKVLGWQ
ncbi:MAG TPA: hypothetical protein VGY58_07185 [Gemmataceae bacterium]|jgi:hypothetical protein|nr:hypothetical protein [Gemmataceae bacterium]